MGIKINFEKAQEITRGKLRAERAPLLVALDIEFVRAFEIGQDTTDIIAAKQKLRDITKEVDSAKTLEDLKQIKIKN